MLPRLLPRGGHAPLGTQRRGVLRLSPQRSCTYLNRHAHARGTVRTPLARASSSENGEPRQTAQADEIQNDDPQLWKDAFKKQRAALVRQSLQDGTLGLGFSAGGFLYNYHLGVLWELTKLKILPPPHHPDALKMAGSSAGSLAIVTYACGLDVEVATQAMLDFAADCRNNGTRARLSLLLRDFLMTHLPDDAHLRCEGLVHVGLTRVFPVWKPELVSAWESKEDLIDCLMASCHIPVYASGDFMIRFRGKWYMDGGLTGFIPSLPECSHTVKVCCFPVNQVVERVARPRVLKASRRVASFLDVSISPDAFPTEDFNPSYPQIVQWALVPAEDEVLRKLTDKGRHDAHAWAVAMGLVPGSVESGKEVEPVPGAEAAERTLQESTRRES